MKFLTLFALDFFFPADFTLHWMPKEEGPMQCPFMLFVHNKDRNSGSSREHYSGAIRHRQDPLCCVFFALAYHIFLTYIVEKAIPFPDVTPRPEGFTEEADTASLKNFVAESSPGEAITSKEMAEYLIRPWYNQKLVYGYERGERGAGGAPNPRKEICRRTLRAEHKFAHANILHAFSDALHFKSLEPLRSGITEGVSRQQVGLAGCYHDGGVLDVHYLSKSVTMEFIRDKANFPIRRGYFKVDRMITDVDTCFADKIFEPIYERLHTYIAARDDSESEARKKEVHESDRQLVILLRYLGVVLVQDLAFLVNRGDFVGHPILGHEFFRDDTYGFQTFRKEQQHDIKESQNTVERWVERLRRVLENAGETELAETFETMFETFTSKTVGNSGSLPPQQTSQHSSPSQPPIGSIVETCSGTLDASDVPSEPGTFSGNCSSPIPLIESSPAPFKPTAVASDVATWPKLPESKDLPDFVLCIRFGNDVKTVQDVADEYYRKFGENAGIREVELFYGPKVRNGSKAKGLSYRAKALYENGTRHFTRRNLIYRVLEEKGEVDGVRDLQARISEKFPGEEPKWPHIKWLQDDLNRENVMRNPKRSRIIKEAFEVKSRKWVLLALSSAHPPTLSTAVRTALELAR